MLSKDNYYSTSDSPIYNNFFECNPETSLNFKYDSNINKIKIDYNNWNNQEDYFYCDFAQQINLNNIMDLKNKTQKDFVILIMGNVFHQQ